MQEWIIKVTAQFPDGSPIEPKGINVEWCNDCCVLAREKCKISWIDWGAIPVNEKEALCELIKAHYVFPSEHEEHGKRATILTIGGGFEGSDMHSTSSMLNLVFHPSIGLGSSHQMNGTPSKNYIPLQKPWCAAIEWKIYFGRISSSID
jgi:hypothetical protein